MKAVILSRHAKKDLSGIALGSMQSREPGQGEIRIALKAAAINPTDLHIASGELAMMSPRKLPIALGVDGAGIVDAVGPGVTRFKRGDRVALYTGLVWSGTLAETITVDQSWVASIPDAWSFAEAAAAPLSLLVAKRSLDRAGLKAGERLLVNGGGGAVGSACVALAKGRGLLVETTGNEADRAYAGQIGASAHHDYKTVDDNTLARRFDGAIDTLGGPSLKLSLVAVKRGGSVVSLKVMTGMDDLARIGMTPPLPIRLLMPLIFARPILKARKAGIRLVGLASWQDGADLAAAFAEADAIGFRPRIHTVFRFDDALAALAMMQTGKPRGKIVVEVAA